MIGAAFAAAAPAVPSWKSGFSDGRDNIGGLVSAILAPTGGFGKLLVVLLALSVPSACAPTMYTFGSSFMSFDPCAIQRNTGTSFMSVAPIFARVPRYIFAIVSEAMSVQFLYEIVTRLILIF